MKIEFEWFDRLEGAAAALALEGWLECRSAGFAADQPFHMNGYTKSVVAYIDAVPVGSIAFEHMDFDKSLFVSMSFVRLEHRRKGLYRAMRDRLVYEAKTVFKVSKITSAVHVNNINMHQIAEHLGFRADAVMFTQTL